MLNEFEEYLAHSLDAYPDGKVKEAALYSLLNGGKRVRPKLLFAVLNAYHIPVKKGYAAAAAIEMIHTYSLIHDDLPAMDNDELRRGKATCHVAYGEDMAILAGDALLTHSFSLLTSATKDNNANIKIIKEISESSGLKGMIYGQEKDILNDINAINNIKVIEEIHHLKTGMLISVPCVIAAILANKEGDIEEWRKIGFAIGLLFQIQDDVFDQVKSTQELGKPAHSDESNDKGTYVSLLGIKKCEEIIKQLYDDSIASLKQLSIDESPILEMFTYLLNRNF